MSFVHSLPGIKSINKKHHRSDAFRLSVIIKIIVVFIRLIGDCYSELAEDFSVRVGENNRGVRVAAL